jgi:hypothetical protein
MHNKSMVKCFPNYNLEVDLYEHCIYGKENHVIFPSGAIKERRFLELICSGMFGTIPIPSLGGSLYYVSFIDDFSRKTWLHFLRKKSKVLKSLSLLWKTIKIRISRC